jgi:hypothetical protein
MEFSKRDYNKIKDKNKLEDLNTRIEDLELKIMEHPKDEIFSGKELIKMFDKLVSK